MRRLIFPLIVTIWAGQSFAADQLPAADEEESFDIEPALLIPYERPREPVIAKENEAGPQPAVDIEKLTKDVERAKRSALNAERLFRMGALARVEAEQRALRVVRLQAELENAKLARLKTDNEKADTVAAIKASPVASAAAPKPNDIELARAIQSAHAAARKREQAEIEAAEANLARQQKLLSLGSGRKADVAKAAQKLEQLKAGRN